MRLHLGAVPKSPDFVPDCKWRPLREPSPWLAQLIALPLGIAVTGLLAFLWYLLTPLRNYPSAFSTSHVLHSFLNLPVPSFLLLILGVLGLMALHELLHAVVHPKAGLSPHTVLGFWPSTLLCYAYYDDELSRNRLVASLLTPLIVISIVPLVVIAVGQVAFGWVAVMSCFNAFASCVDMLGVGMLLFQVPRTAIVRNQGWKSYWRQPEITTA